MANNWILPEQETAFALHPDYGLHFAEIYPPVFALVEGESYTVRWDGAEYICQAGPLQFMGMEWQVVGNKALLGGEDTGEPFGIGSVSSDGVPASNVMATTDTADSHTVGIALGEIREPGILLADHTGEQINYGFPDRLRVDTSEGETEDYVRNGLLPEAVEKTVALDFSAGAMAVTPEAGQVFSGVKIPVPANLLAENIAEGVNIAGVIGSMVADTGGAEIAVSSGKILGNEFLSSKRINHNLGVMPDLLLVFPGLGSYSINTGDTNNNSKFLGLIYLSPAFAAKCSGAGFSVDTNRHIIEIYGGTPSYIYGRSEITVTEKTVTVSFVPPTIQYFDYVAIGGLT